LRQKFFQRPDASRSQFSVLNFLRDASRSEAEIGLRGLPLRPWANRMLRMPPTAGGVAEGRERSAGLGVKFFPRNFPQGPSRFRRSYRGLRLCEADEKMLRLPTEGRMMRTIKLAACSSPACR